MFWQRIGASVIDLLLFFALYKLILLFIAPASIPLNNTGELHRWISEYDRAKQISLFITTIAFSSYVIIAIKWWGATLGKKIFKLKVCAENGEISYRMAFVRFSPYLTFLLIYILLNGPSFHYWLHQSYFYYCKLYLWCYQGIIFIWFSALIYMLLKNKQSRVPHDFLAKTVVIKV